MWRGSVFIRIVTSMRHRALITASAALCLFVGANTAEAQLASSCLRPLGIPDKWVENQTGPWDPTDTFDPTGPNPDFYAGGFDAVADHGLPMSLVLYDRIRPLQGSSAWPIVVGEPGSTGFLAAIENCSGYLHAIGASFPSITGFPTGPLETAIKQLIDQDPNAVWDPTADGGRGGVINSAFEQSPRIIALPAFAPDSYVTGTQMSPPMVKILGFFVSHQANRVIYGYLTSRSQLAAPPVTARLGEYAQLSATFTGPGSPIAGLGVEFFVNDALVATAETDGTGTARPETTAFRVADYPGQYPGAIRVRLREPVPFFIAEDAVADLTVLRRLPAITWLPQGDITYGTPLDSQQLNAVADVPGTFTYTPAAGTVLLPREPDVSPLSVTFVPYNSEFYDETTATSFVTVRRAPLTVTVHNAQKLYLDPLPAFTFTVTGLVNGDSPSVVSGTTSFLTSATALSPVGTYPVTFASIGVENYVPTLNPGVLTIVPRPTVTVLQSAIPSPSTFGESVAFTIAVSSDIGTPAGTVSLLRGGVVIASAPLVDGPATLIVSTLNAGNHSLSAQYAGAGGFAASSSPVVGHTVKAASTTTQLASSLNPSRSGQAVTFTATVQAVAPGAGAPAGSVDFLRDGALLATVPLANGSAQLTISTLAPGKHAVQARYTGTNNHLPSVSAVVQQSVKGAGK